jgi:NAD(P)-dependent dehydrogenase (short-subunit alcohol dehydrogenase family)
MTKTILITGASRGIGAACALLAAARGYHAGILARQMRVEQMDAARIGRLKSSVPMGRGGKRTRWRGRSCGCCRTRRPTPPAASSTSRVDVDQFQADGENR